MLCIQVMVLTSICTYMIACALGYRIFLLLSTTMHFIVMQGYFPVNLLQGRME